MKSDQFVILCAVIIAAAMIANGTSWHTIKKEWADIVDFFDNVMGE